MKKYMQLYDSTVQRIENSWLWTRIKSKIEERIENDDSDDLPCLHNTNLSKNDLVDVFHEVDQDWYFHLLPDELKQRFIKIKKAILAWNNSTHWSVARDWVDKTIECDLYDWLLLSWLYSSLITSPEEVRDFSKLWFKSASDLVISVSAYIINLMTKDFWRWYKWITEHNGKKFITTLDWDTNRDFVVKRFDMTEYDTVNFCWDKSSIRPRSDPDTQHIYWSYNTEDIFLSSVIRWIIQCNIRSSILEWWFEWIIKLLKNKQIFDEGFDLSWLDNRLDINDKMCFCGFDIPITTYWKNVSSHYWVPKHHWWINLALVKWDELVFTDYNSGWEIWNSPNINCSFHPNEADEILKWILVQAYNGRGRTSIYQILWMFSYYFEKKDLLLKWQF